DLADLRDRYDPQGRHRQITPVRFTVLHLHGRRRRGGDTDTHPDPHQGTDSRKQRRNSNDRANYLQNVDDVRPDAVLDRIGSTVGDAVDCSVERVFPRVVGRVEQLSLCMPPFVCSLLRLVFVRLLLRFRATFVRLEEPASTPTVAIAGQALILRPLIVAVICMRIQRRLDAFKVLTISSQDRSYRRVQVCRLEEHLIRVANINATLINHDALHVLWLSSDGLQRLGTAAHDAAQELNFPAAINNGGWVALDMSNNTPFRRGWHAIIICWWN